jgi:hypothetical protein
MGEKIMKITIMGVILIIVAVLAALIILDVSVENPSLTRLLANIRNASKNNKRPDRQKGISGSEHFPGTTI